MPSDRSTVDEQCTRFLQWALPRLGYRWPGFRRVRRQVCRRVRRRMAELDLADFGDYARHLERRRGEWSLLDGCCRVTISRFYRDRRVWDVLGTELLPELYAAAARREPSRLRIWSAGCGAGEEPYTLALLLALGPSPLPPGVDADILGTDLDAGQLERARHAVYPESSLRELPEGWRREAFEPRGDGRYRLVERHQKAVAYLEQDIRAATPGGRFDLVLCRNLVFTYFDARTRRPCLERLIGSLRPDGWLAVGSHEDPLADSTELTPHASGEPLFTKVS